MKKSALPWIVVADLKAGQSGTEYGIDAVTPLNWTITRRNFRAREYGRVLPPSLTDTPEFAAYMGGAKSKTIYTSLQQLKERLRPMLKTNPRKRMKRNPSAPITVQVIGSRVQLHPGTDAWMRGDKYGEVIGVTRDKRRYKVKMDKSGRVLKVSPDYIYEIIDAPRRNPKRRRKIKVPPRQFRVSMSGRKLRYRGSARNVVLAGHKKRERITSDPRREKRLIRKAGVRVNPNARRATFIVKVKNRSGGLVEQGIFRSKPVAVDYARALHRKYPRLTVAVYSSKG